MKKYNTIKTLILTALCIMSVSGTAMMAEAETIVPGKVRTTKEYDLPKFRRISYESSGNMKIIQNTDQSVIIKAPDNVLAYIDCNVDNDRLVISTRPGINFDGNPNISITVNVADLDYVSDDAAGDINFDKGFNTRTLAVNMNGTGDVSLPQFSCEALKVDNNGTGNFSSTGSCGNLDLSTSGTGDITCNYSVMGNVFADTTGTGDIRLKGECKEADLVSSGTGNILAKNLKASSTSVSATGTGNVECYASTLFTGSHGSMCHITCHGNPADKNITPVGYSFPK